MRWNKTVLGTIVTILFILYILQKKRSHKYVNLKSLLEYALKSAEIGGKAILQSKSNLIIKKKGMTKEGLEDKVTSADFLSHCSMVKTIKEKFPNLNIISEESDAFCSSNIEINGISNGTPINFLLEDEWVKAEEVTVWIDPLDATQEFTEKLYEYVTTMVCVALNGRPIIGVIHKPFQNITSWAWVKKGRSIDLNTTPKVEDEKLRISISRSHSGKIREILSDKLKNYQLIIAAGAGYKSLQVAHKEIEAYLHITAIKKWDICAGNAIIEDLGGKMTDKENNLIDYSSKTNKVNENGLITTLNNKVHSIFVELFQ